MIQSQKTLKDQGRLTGVGIHTGELCTVIFKPAPVDTGIRFMKNGQAVDLDLDAPKSEAKSLRCTTLGVGDLRIQTVEHLLAALSGSGLTNLVVEVEGNEIPILDGSAKSFTDTFKQLGIEEQAMPRDVYSISEPIFCYEGSKALAALPSDDFSVSYVLDYPHPMLQGQKFEWNESAHNFETEIAPARTFCTEEEAKALQAQGFGRGGDASNNTIVMGESGPVGTTLRFSDECARHKILDIIGDLSLLGFALKAKVVGIRSGHTLNQMLAREIKKRRDA